MRVRGGRGVRAGAGPGDACSWLPGVTCGSSVCHGSSLLRDLVDDGLHELWRKVWDVDRSGTFRLRGHRNIYLIKQSATSQGLVLQRLWYRSHVRLSGVYTIVNIM